MAEPGELTSGDQIVFARQAVRSLTLLLEAIQRDVGRVADGSW